MEAVITYFGFSFSFIISLLQNSKIQNTRIETKDLCKNDEPVLRIVFILFYFFYIFFFSFGWC